MDNNVSNAKIYQTFLNGLQLKSDVSLIFFSDTKLDPDAPSRANPSVREGLHWLVTNIPGCDIEKGDQFAEYVGSGAPKETGMFFAHLISYFFGDWIVMFKTK